MYHVESSINDILRSFSFPHDFHVKYTIACANYALANASASSYSKSYASRMIESATDVKTSHRNSIKFIGDAIVCAVHTIDSNDSILYFHNKLIEMIYAEFTEEELTDLEKAV